MLYVAARCLDSQPVGMSAWRAGPSNALASAATPLNRENSPAQGRGGAVLECGEHVVPDILPH